MMSPTPPPEGEATGPPSTELTLNLQIDRNGTEVLLRLVGELDAVSAPWLLQRLSGGLIPEGSRVVLDLSGVTFLDVAGARAVSTLQERLVVVGAQLTVVGLRSGPLLMARHVGLDQLVRLGSLREPAGE